MGKYTDLILKKITDTKIISRVDLKAFCEKKGVPSATFNRTINALILTHITPIKYPVTLKYGIPKNKKTTHFILNEYAEEAEYYDTIIKALQNENKQVRQNALTEIEAYDTEFELTPSQLTYMTKSFALDDEEIGYQIARIISKQINVNKLPSDLETFKKNTYGGLVKLHPKHIGDRDNYTEHLLRFLGVLDDERILEFLETEIVNSKKIDQIIERYSLWEIARVIDKKKTKLFKLSNKLSNEQSQALFRLRDKAKYNVKSYHGNIKNLEQALAKNKK